MDQNKRMFYSTLHTEKLRKNASDNSWSFNYGSNDSCLKGQALRALVIFSEMSSL